MGPSFWDLAHTLYGFGDNTAGPIWRNTFSPGSPLGGYISNTNYPLGENLYSPVGISSLFQSVPIWVLARLFSPVIAYNLFNIIGYVFTSSITYLFILKFLKNNWIAWLTGVVASFAPYYQVKIGGHPSYAFSGIFIATIWLFIIFVQRPTRLISVMLGILLAATLYFDPYFVLYEFLTLFALVLGWIAWHIRHGLAGIGAEIKILVMPIITSITVLVVLAIPLGIVYLQSRSEIQAQVSSVRGNVLGEAKACSNYPHEYMLPFVLLPAARVIGADGVLRSAEIKLKDNFSCGIGEDTVGVSLTMLLVIGVTGIILTWELVNHRGRKLNRNDTLGLLFAFGVGLLLIGVAFGLPPKSFHGLPTPTKLLLDATTTWRTLTRSFMLVNISLVIIFSLALLFYSKNLKISRNIKRLGFVIISALIFIEYQAFMPLRGNEMSSFNMDNSAPKVYQYLEDQKDISVVAEYPMESYGESDATSYYLSMQLIHGKKLLNASSPTSQNEILRKSIKDLDDPQTIPILKAMGVDAIVLHGVDDHSLGFINQFEHSAIFEQPKFTLMSHSSVTSNDKSVVLKLSAPNKDTTVVAGLLKSGFYRNLGIIKGPLEWSYEATNGAQITMQKISGGKISDANEPLEFCFSIRTSAPSEVASLQLVIDGKYVPMGVINNTYRKLSVRSGKQITLQNNLKSNMQINQLGCQ